MKTNGVLRCALTVAICLGSATGAYAEQSVTEEILSILKDTGKVTEEKYEELKTRAEAENKAAEEAEGSYRIYWNRGLRFESPDRDFRIKFGGRIQNDWSLVMPSEAIQQEFGVDSVISGTKIKRARFYMSGTLFENFLFKAQYEYAGGDVGIKDVFVGMQNIPVIGTILVGHMKEPYSLEQLNSTNTMTFMDRGPSSWLDAARNTGITMYPRFFEKRLGLDVGAYLDVGDTGSLFDAKSNYNVSTRLYGLPWYDNGGRHMAYIGGSYTHQFRNGSTVRYRGRPGSSFGPILIDTGDIITNGNDLMNISAALVIDSFAAQAEYSHSWVDAASGPDPDFNTWFVQGSYLLTGEFRPMNLQKGAFAGITPNRPFGFGEGSGWGAFQVAARYSVTNYNSKDIEGGRLNDVTLGFNWFPNTAFTFKINYIYSDRDPIGSQNVLECRFQVVF